MSAVLLKAARRLIDVWVRLYTCGLPATHRRQRGELIRADVFEEVTESRLGGATPLAAALSLLSRWARGIPDDLTWRLFEARRLPGAPSISPLDRRHIMVARTSGAAFFAVAAGLSWAATLVIATEPVAHSLAYAAGVLAMLALAGWAIEARGSVEDEAAPSAWPLMLAVGIVAIAGGMVFDGGRTGLLLAVPLALGMSGALIRALAGTRAESRVPEAIEVVSSAELARHAARGEAIAIEARPQRGVSRRAVLQGGFGIGMTSVLAAMGGIVVDFLWQRNVAGFGGVVSAGKAADFPPGSKTIVREGKFWLVNLTEAQGGPGFLALWQKCPHLGCVVPWNERFSHVDPETGRAKEGWFRCPCHQSTYNDAGVRVYGPAPQSMDRMALRVTEMGYIEVNTGEISKGTDENASFAVGADDPPSS